MSLDGRQRRPNFLDAPVSIIPISIGSAAPASQNSVSKILTDLLHSERAHSRRSSLKAVGACLQQSERVYSSPDISWDNKPVVKKSPLNDPTNTCAKVADLILLRPLSGPHSGLTVEDISTFRTPSRTWKC